MAIGERIRFIRNLKGMTQKYLGIKAGFDEKTADIRMAQYESGTRTPKSDMTSSIAGVLDVSPLALSVPDIDSEQGLLHTLFALEDLYGIKPELADNKIFLTLDSSKPTTNLSIFGMLKEWAEQAQKYKLGKISKDEYDDWRYNFPNGVDGFVKVPSKEFSDAMVEKFRDKLKDM